jgi:hypothetical protein
MKGRGRGVRESDSGTEEVGMDGCVVTETADEAFAAYEEPGVRHVAALDTGEGIVFFVGDRPAAGQLLVTAEDQPDAHVRIRWARPGPNQVEAFYLFDRGAFEVISDDPAIEAVTYLASGNVLVMTDGTQLVGPTSLWHATATAFRDVRVFDGELVSA